MRLHDFKIWEGECFKDVYGNDEHSLNVAGCHNAYYEYCLHCGKAWNLTNKQAKNIWEVHK